MTLLDSGTRRKFDSGAVRDCAEGKGRCDLLPLNVTCKWLGWEGKTLLAIALFIESKKIEDLFLALNSAYKELGYADKESAILDVAKQFEDGATKYGDRNWEKGIPVHCYIDSAIRHYLKWRKGDTDEPHDRAVLWNLMCCAWTMFRKPELLDL